MSELETNSNKLIIYIRGFEIYIYMHFEIYGYKYQKCAI
jgi:hypothetical protein